MKRIIAILLLVIIACCGCTASSNNKDITKSQIRNIAKMATLKTYYHNVAKYKKEKSWFWGKETHFWISYSGIVKIGTDFSDVKISKEGDKITIGNVKTEILGAKVDESTLNKKSFIYAEDSAKPNAKEQIKAFKDSLKEMKKSAEKDKELLLEAEERAKSILENYVKSIGEMMDKKYTIDWK